MGHSALGTDLETASRNQCPLSDIDARQTSDRPTASEPPSPGRTGPVPTPPPIAGPDRRPLVAIPAGVTAFLAAFFVRDAIHPHLPPGFPFLTFFPAVILSTYFCGAMAGLVCATLSGLAAWYFFVPTGFVMERAVVTALALYTVVVGIDIVLIHLMQRAMAELVRAEATARALLDQRGHLASELERETACRRMHERLAEHSLLLDLALKAADAGTWHYSVASGCALLSAEMARQHGLGEAEIEVDLRRDWQPLVHPEDAVRTLADLEDAIAARGTFVSDFRIPLPTGETRWLSCIGRAEIGPAGEAEWVVGLTLDVTVRKLAERRSEHLARHDPLTGLANRMQFQERFLQEIARVKRGGAPFALLCLDLDRFKAVNDTLGHAAGDTLLRIVADRLRSAVRTEDTVARLGGDEFVVIQTGATSRDDAAVLGGRIAEAVAAPLAIEGHTVEIGVSIGIALVPCDGADPDAVYRIADRALYRAKADGRSLRRQAT